MSSDMPRRVSLRRKRLDNEAKEGNQSKRKSPSIVSPDKNTQSSNGIGSNCLTKIQNIMSSASPRTPKNDPRRKEETFVETPVSCKDPCQKPPLQLSPTSPFSLSQMPSTQDCEVVWDCNSPGYSKEDLKKMCNKSSEKSYTPSPVILIPNQLHLGQFRPPVQLATRKGPNTSTTLVAALDSLLTKVNGENLKRLESDQLNDDGTSLDCLDSSLLKSSSQPFDVSDIGPNFPSETELGGARTFDAEDSACCAQPGAGARLSTQRPKSLKESRSESVCAADGRSGAMSTIGNNSDTNIHRQQVTIVGSRHSGSLSDSTTSTAVSEVPVANGSGVDSDLAVDASFLSTDDDLFSESFLKASQAMEDALFNKETGRFDTPSVPKKKDNYPISPLSRIRKKKPVVLFPSKVKGAVGSLSSDERFLNNCGGLNPAFRLRKEDGPISPSPVNGRERKSPLRKSDVGSGSQVEEVKDGEASKESCGIDWPVPVASNSDKVTDTVDWKPIPKQNGLRASFQLDDMSGCANGREKTPQIHYSFCSRKLLSKENQNVKHPDEGCAQPHFQQKKTTPINNFVSNIHSSSTNCFSTKDQNEVDTNAFASQEVLFSESETAKDLFTCPDQGYLLRGAFDPPPAPMKNAGALGRNFSQELDDDEDEFAALMPSLVEVEAEHSRNALSQYIRSASKGIQNSTCNISKVPSEGGQGSCSTKPPASGRNTTKSGSSTYTFVKKDKDSFNCAAQFKTNAENIFTALKGSSSVAKEGAAKDITTINAGFNIKCDSTRTSAKSMFNGQGICNFRNTMLNNNNNNNNNHNHNNNFTWAFKRPIFASITNYIGKTVGGSSQTLADKVVWGSSTRLFEEQKGAIFVKTESSFSLSNSHPSVPSNTVSSSKSRVHQIVPDTQNTMLTTIPQDDGFGDDDDLFIQEDVLESISPLEYDGFGDDDDIFIREDVLESISLLESQYMARQTQKKGFDSRIKGDETGALPSLRPPLGSTHLPRTSNSASFQVNPRSQASKPSNSTKEGASFQSIAQAFGDGIRPTHPLGKGSSTSGGTSLLHDRHGNEVRTRFSAIQAHPLSWNAAKMNTLVKGRNLPSRKKGEFDFQTDGRNEPKTIEVPQKRKSVRWPKGPKEEECNSDEDLVSLALENSFEEAFIDASLSQAAESALPSPDFCRPFKPPSFTGVRTSKSNATATASSRESLDQSVDKFHGNPTSITFSHVSGKVDLSTSPSANKLFGGPTNKVSLCRHNPFTNLRCKSTK